MLRDRYDPMNLFDLVPALSLELDYAVLAGNPQEAGQVVPGVDHHLERFKKLPRRVAGDRGAGGV